MSGALSWSSRALRRRPEPLADDGTDTANGVGLVHLPDAASNENLGAGRKMVTRSLHCTKKEDPPALTHHCMGLRPSVTLVVENTGPKPGG